MSKIILLSIISLSLFGCIHKYEKADYTHSYNYPSEENIQAINNLLYSHFYKESNLPLEIFNTEIKNDTLIIYSYNGQFILNEPLERFPTLDYFLNRFPEPPTVTEKNKNTYVVKYKSSVIEIVSEEIFREYSMILVKNAVIVDICDIFMCKLKIGMSKQQCMTILNLDDQYQAMMDSLKVLYFKSKYEWYRLTFNDEEIFEKIELNYDL